MKLIVYTAGAYNKKRKYSVTDDEGGTIATLDSLERAGVLLRYLRGAGCSQEESALAMEIIREIDKQ